MIRAKAKVLDTKPKLFPDLVPVWNAFTELSNARPQGFSGACGIPSTEIKAWLELQRITDFEYWVPLLRAMDAAYLTKNEQEPNPDD